MTEMNETNGVILKTDRRGRLRYSQEQKQAFIEAFEASGLSAPRFAAHHGVNHQTLISWLKKRRQSNEDHPALRAVSEKARSKRGLKHRSYGFAPRRSYLSYIARYDRYE